MPSCFSDRDYSDFLKRLASAVAALVSDEVVYRQFQDQIRKWAAELRSREFTAEQWKEDRRRYFLETVVNDERLWRPMAKDSPPPDDAPHWERWDSELGDGKTGDSKALLAAFKNKNTPIEAFVDVSWAVKGKFWNRFRDDWKRKQQEQTDGLKAEIQRVNRVLNGLKGELREATGDDVDENVLTADIARLEEHKEIVEGLLKKPKPETPRDLLNKSQRQTDYELVVEASIKGWAPERFVERNIPDTSFPIPLPEKRELTLSERYAVLAAIRDVAGMAGQVNPFSDDADDWQNAHAYLMLRSKVEELTPECEQYLEIMLTAIEKDIKSANQNGSETTDDDLSNAELDVLAVLGNAERWLLIDDITKLREFPWAASITKAAINVLIEKRLAKRKSRKSGVLIEDAGRQWLTKNSPQSP